MLFHKEPKNPTALMGRVLQTIMKKLSVTISGHRTSITLEDEFADALRDIARTRKKHIAELIKEIDEQKPGGGNLSSAIRVFILKNKS